PIQRMPIPAGEAEEGPPRNIFDVEMETMRVTPLSLWQLIPMSMFDSNVYVMKLLRKSVFVYPKVERIVPFQTSELVGFLLVRDGGSKGTMIVSSRDRKISQSMTFKLDPAPAELPGEELST